jgi:hypothetical protein
MELSILRLQDPAPGGSAGERRRRIRHKLHSPVYASFNRPSTGMVLDLSELLDLSEDGFCVQTSERLEVDRPVTLSLDLPETKAYIHGTGQVVWSDGAGRGGIQFSPLPDGSPRLLKEWLFVNLLIARANYAARTAPVAGYVETKPSAPQPILQSAVPAPVPDLSGMLSAVEAVRREVRAAGDDFDAALHLITERALSLTGASGAALAFLTEDKMTCRACAGEPALPLGTAVDAKQGLSGECVRSGRMVACEDAETDPRVDREICRMLGIGSILATPIFSDFRVVGLLEVFSPHPRAFTEVHETALDRLVEIVPKAKAEVVKPPEAKAETKTSELPPAAARTDPTVHAIREALWEPERVAQEQLKGVPVRRLHLLLLAMTVAISALALGYVLAPTIEKRWLSKPEPSSHSTAAIAPPPAVKSASPAKSPQDLRRLAEQGDAYSQWIMGMRYHNGEGVPQDDAQAMRWFERAADQGYIDAQATMGAYYWAGRGVPKDLSKAYFWSVLALNQGDASMESRLQGLALQMTRAQVAAAQQQADDWLRQHQAAK